MEKPNWVYRNKTHFNHFMGADGIMQYYFLAFEHNWDMFQFLPNSNMYFFFLNKGPYNFNVIYRTYLQKCKHIELERICFILSEEKQEDLLKELPIKFKYIMKSSCNELFKQYGITDTFFNNFSVYDLPSAVGIVNSSEKFNIDNTLLIKSTTDNYIKRSPILTKNSIVFFGASVTGQHCGYVDFIKHPTITTVAKSYSGCTIQDATWLVDDIIELKPSICILEWITSIYKPNKQRSHEQLDIIIQKLLNNNIIPIILYLYKTDISDFLEQIECYEEIARYYNINSIHLYKVIMELNIHHTLILKDSCHTNYTGSKLYGSILKLILDCEYSDIDTPIYPTMPYIVDNPYTNIRVFPIDIPENEFKIFNNKKYFKIKDTYTFLAQHGITKLHAINILYSNNNGFIYINDVKRQTWDKNCYYMRYGYLQLGIKFTNNIILTTSQELFDTSVCKYETNFPTEKSLWISEIIVL